MWRKPFALLLSLSLLSPCLSAQDLSSDDRAIIEKQEQIISIVQSLKESDRISEQNLIAREDSLNQKELELSKKERDYATIDQDMATLKYSLKKQSESLSREQKMGKWKTRGIIALSACLAGSIIYGMSK
jgi:flagellar motility protein MotE (MotC chaperone)